MLWTIFIVFILLWLLGLITAHTFGGLIHFFIFAAIVIFIIKFWQQVNKKVDQDDRGM
ncbi:MAG: lmo0937 family membrane protein [Candidatus Paceibacterota bacterium]